MAILPKARNAWSLLRLRELALARARCPLCGPTLLIKLANDAISVRCIRCGASAIHLSIMRVINELYPDLAPMTIYEMSSRGPLVEYLRHRAGKLVCSEYFDDVASGDFKDGTECQDVTRLTYPDGSFDLCTSTEVFEHVPDDRTGFREVRRVLKPGGQFVFTVPLTESASTQERATVVDGAVRHFLPPEYHGDTIRGQGKVLAFRNYGLDIADRLVEAGFRRAELVGGDGAKWWGLGTKVVVAEK
ncbi:MAG: class I SAM-dependent methyltransferase [Betaproteobacteria bacterium]|nr:class I SAM-dependent methyltransferase [Betaproteobacteria bacterium]